MAKKDLKTCQANAQELRYKSYAELLAIYEMDPSPESRQKSKIVASTIRTEKCREMFRQIRISARPFQENSGGLSSVMIPRITNLSPDQDNSYQPITLDIYKWLAEQPHGPSQLDTIIERSDVENHLLKFNHASFRAASASPCGQGVIMDALTFSSMSPAGHSFLRGIVPPEWHGQDALLKEFLISFIAPSRVLTTPEISTKITEDDITKGFGKWKETTSTSPSGRHLGHYRAIIKHPLLLECLTKFMSISIERGISITRWQQAVNCYVGKRPGTSSNKPSSHYSPV
jgi:hypothetical protein